MAEKVLKRTMFETSRVLEYFTERELILRITRRWSLISYLNV